MQKATNDLVTASLQSISKQLTSGANIITSLEIESSGVAVAGPILGVLAAWLIAEINGIMSEGYCNGPVALEQYVVSGRDLQASTLNGPYQTTTVHPGTDSRDGCGPTSQYEVSWSISRVK